MSEKPYKVSVQGPGISIERDVAEGALPRLMAILVTDVAPPIDPPGSSTSSTGSSGVSVGEFLADLNINTNPERIAGIALFARDVLSRERVSRDEIPDWFQRAGQPAPKNLFRDIKNAVAMRLIAEDHLRAGEYLITETGIKALRGQKPAAIRAAKSTPRKSASEASTADARKKTKAGTGDGPMGKIQELIDEDWFASPRTVAQLLDELAARGTHYKNANVTLQMQTVVKEKKLRRQKKTPDGGKREVWHYSNW